MSMPLFRRRELVRFLKAVDRLIDRPFRVDIIGGSAAAIAFRAKSGTMDMDLVTDVSLVESSIELARLKTGLHIPVSFTSVYDAPYLYEHRMKRVLRRDLKKLQVFIPEKHDWALMKIVRFLDKDIEDIVEVADLRADGSIPELTEASLRTAIPVLYKTLGRDSRAKVGLIGAGEGTPAGQAPVKGFMSEFGPSLGLSGIYGDPFRGYAGGYLPAP